MGYFPECVPEGDTIFKLAQRLRPVLLDLAIESLSTRRHGPLPEFAGRKITSIDARGKHLLITIEPHWVLRVHLGMHGRWRVETRASAATATPGASVMVRTARGWAVCRRALQVELTRRDDPRLRDTLRRLGPDLLGENVEWDTIVTRARKIPSATLADALLDQSIATGIGNVYKSETLFLTRADPFATVGTLDDDVLRAILGEARRLMKQNLRGGARVTRRRFGSSRLWVYGRSGKPCFECGTPIRMRRQGEAGRSTYFCPRCQRVDV